MIARADHAVGVTDRQSSRHRASVHSRSPGWIEPLLVWCLFGVVAIEILVTYSRLPAKVLYNVSGSGPTLGASRFLTFLSYPVALAAIVILLFLLDRPLSRPMTALALLAVGLCATGLFFVRQSNLNGRPVNAIAAAGVVMALVLTLVAPRLPARSPERTRGGAFRLVLALLLLVLAVPVMAADLGFYLDRVPVLGWLYQTGALRREPGVKGLHVAVHHGHHEGFDGVLLAWSTLLLWPCLALTTHRRRAGLFGAFLVVMLCYGIAVAAGDFWLEQIVKRGWVSWQLPDVLLPGLTWGWAGLLVVSAALWAILVRPHLPPARADRGLHAGAL